MKKSSTPKKPKTNAPAQTPITKVNLDKFEKELSGVQLKEKKVRETIYTYPAEFTKELINSDKGKKFRNSMRNKMKFHCNNILTFAKSKDMEKLAKEVKDFKAFYKANYRLNDFSLASISQSNDATKEKDLNLMIQILKEIQ